uniref:Uncharacterized protein n=1 Tax=Tanacetum cinerariifolium TaxID=118510 RepID=A0A6L2JUV5_TANCI|nr:hypothetical protein [Tanacetum cinerariifolium]
MVLSDNRVGSPNSVLDNEMFEISSNESDLEVIALSNDEEVYNDNVVIAQSPNEKLITRFYHIGIPPFPIKEVVAKNTFKDNALDPWIPTLEQEGKQSGGARTMGERESKALMLKDREKKPIMEAKSNSVHESKQAIFKPPFSSWDDFGFTITTPLTSGFSAQIMKMEPDIESMTLNEYLEYEAEKERQLWDNFRSKSSPTRRLRWKKMMMGILMIFGILRSRTLNELGKFCMPNVPDEMDKVIQPLIPQPIHTTPPNDDYVASATNSILDELSHPAKAETRGVTRMDIITTQWCLYRELQCIKETKLWTQSGMKIPKRT